MLLQLVYLVSLLAVIVICQAYGYPRLPRPGNDWLAAAARDPRVAVTVMMYVVATQDGPLTDEKEERILSQLRSRLGLELNLARTCLAASRQIANYLHGDFDYRLHKPLRTIQRHCTWREKQDVVEMLEAVAGRGAASPGPVRHGLDRLAATLLRG